MLRIKIWGRWGRLQFSNYHRHYISMLIHTLVIGGRLLDRNGHCQLDRKPSAGSCGVGLVGSVPGRAMVSASSQNAVGTAEWIIVLAIEGVGGRDMQGREKERSWGGASFGPGVVELGEVVSQPWPAGEEDGCYKPTPFHPVKMKWAPRWPREPEVTKRHQRPGIRRDWFYFSS